MNEKPMDDDEKPDGDCHLHGFNVYLRPGPDGKDVWFCDACGKTMPPEFQVANPTVANPTFEDLQRALYEVTGQRSDQMDCPVDGCSGRVEAQSRIWFNISPEGLPSVYGIGWHEGGEILCTRGGDHIPGELQRQLWLTLLQYSATLENLLVASAAEDTMPHKSES